ncbi:MAG: hypothetical protein ABFD08_19075 [Syntrophomonas sp.]
MKTLFLILIVVVFIVTIVFGILIWRQTIKIEKKALEAKMRKEEYLKQLELEKEMELLKKKEIEGQAEPGGVACAGEPDNPETQNETN